MSRFDCADDADTIPWEMWKTIVSRALAGKRGQRALAEFEEALLALPERKLVEGTLASEEGVCAIGALVALKRAKRDGIEMAEAIAAMPKEDPDDGDIFDTALAGQGAGLSWSVAWHMAYLNDETFEAATPEQRYEKILAWVRRAQGKPETAVRHS
jgi:hypothetical protein